jgi:CHAD domain-containing protein
MSYIIQQILPLNQEIKQIINERIEDSEQHLYHYDLNPDEAVHEFRKNMKKIRAVLRLIRYSIPDKKYKELNAFYRDLSKQFALVREACVHLETLNNIKNEEEAPSATAFAEKMLNSYYQRARQQISQQQDILTKTREKLKHSEQEIDNLTLEEDSFELVRAGLKKVYQQGRKTKNKAKSYPDGKHFHEWRKRVKYLWYHLRLLRNTWPVVMKGYNKSLDRLSDYLGEEHDLAELKRLILETDQLNLTSEREKEELAYKIDKKRSGIQSNVWPAGEKLYFDKPKRFIKRIAHYWYIENEQNDSS